MGDDDRVGDDELFGGPGLAQYYARLGCVISTYANTFDGGCKWLLANLAGDSRPLNSAPPAALQKLIGGRILGELKTSLRSSGRWDGEVKALHERLVLALPHRNEIVHRVTVLDTEIGGVSTTFTRSSGPPEPKNRDIVLDSDALLDDIDLAQQAYRDMLRLVRLTVPLAGER